MFKIYRVQLAPNRFLKSNVTRSFFFHDHSPCAHRVVPLSHWNLKCSRIRHFYGNSKYISLKYSMMSLNGLFHGFHHFYILIIMFLMIGFIECFFFMKSRKAYREDWIEFEHIVGVWDGKFQRAITTNSNEYFGICCLWTNPPLRQQFYNIFSNAVLLHYNFW